MDMDNFCNKEMLTKVELMNRMDEIEAILESDRQLSISLTTKLSDEFNALLDALALSTQVDELKDEFTVRYGKLGRAQAPVHELLDERTLGQLRALATA